MRRAPWPESMRAIFKNWLVDSFQDHSHHFLYELVVAGRNAEGAFLAVLFWDLYSPDRLEAIASFSETLDDGVHPLLREPIQGHSINSFGECAIVGVDVGIGFLP